MGSAFCFCGWLEDGDVDSGQALVELVGDFFGHIFAVSAGIAMQDDDTAGREVRDFQLGDGIHDHVGQVRELLEHHDVLVVGQGVYHVLAAVFPAAFVLEVDGPNLSVVSGRLGQRNVHPLGHRFQEVFADNHRPADRDNRVSQLRERVASLVYRHRSTFFPCLTCRLARG